MDIILNTNFKTDYSFIKENNIQTQFPTKIKINNYTYNCIYENHSILTANSKCLCSKNVIKIINTIRDLETIQNICANHVLEIQICNEYIEHYPSYTLTEHKGDVYIDDLKFIEL